MRGGTVYSPASKVDGALCQLAVFQVKDIGYGLEHGTFARAIGTQKGYDLFVRHLKRYAFEYPDHIAVDDLYVIDFKH
jgi:hypothetical protein